MPGEDTDRRAFTYYVRSGLTRPSPNTLLFVISVLGFFALIAGGLGRYYVDHDAFPTLSLYELADGESRFRRGDFSGALKEFEGAVAVSPADTRYLLNLGAANNALGETSRAIDSFRLVLRFKSDHPDANYYLGLLYLQRNELDLAIQYISRSIAVRSVAESVPAYNDLGVAYSRTGDFISAVDSYERALSIDPDFTAAKKNLASLRERMR